jgi:FkbM family methyltransferase
MNKSLKTAVRTFLIPFTPILVMYIRHFPLPIGKRFCLRVVFSLGKAYTTRTFFGSKMKGRTSDLIQGYIYCFGIWEPSLTRFIQSRLEGLSNRTFVDVGANIGYFSLLIGRCMPKGKVVAIEAFPTIFDHLIENININGYNNIKAVNCAATESPNPVSMYYAGVYNEGLTTSIKGIFNSAPTVVEGRPLGDILSDLEIRTTRLVKIDTEGAEYSVLKGMFPILHRFPKDVEIVVEITPSALDDKEMLEIFTSFKDEGFYPYVLQNPYDTEYYLFSKKTYRPTRMEAFPDTQTDIIFSRIDNKYLTWTSHTLT